MKAVINPSFEQTSFDSAAPSGAAIVAHQFESLGEYDVRFLEGESTVAEARLTVTGEDTRDAATAPDQVSLDLKKLEYSHKMGGGQVRRTPFIVRSRGWVTFTLSGKGKSYAIVAQSTSPDDKKEKKPFDSRRLSSGDIFAVTMCRPGEYRLVNELGKHEGKIVVSYPVIGKTPYRPPPPVNVRCDAGGFQPSTIHLSPAQGIAFQVNTEARLKIELIKPDDGPKERPPRTVRLSPQATRELIERWREKQKEKQQNRKAT